MPAPLLAVACYLRRWLPASRGDRLRRFRFAVHRARCRAWIPAAPRTRVRAAPQESSNAVAIGSGDGATDKPKPRSTSISRSSSHFDAVSDSSPSAKFAVCGLQFRSPITSRSRPRHSDRARARNRTRVRPRDRTPVLTRSLHREPDPTRGASTRTGPYESSHQRPTTNDQSRRGVPDASPSSLSPPRPRTRESNASRPRAATPQIPRLRSPPAQSARPRAPPGPLDTLPRR